MKLNIKAITSVAAPFLIAMVGAGLFIFWYIPEGREYRQVKEQYQTSMRQLEQYEGSSENSAVRSVVTQLERELGKLKEEHKAVQSYLDEKYRFAYIDKFVKLTGLDFKNLVVEKRKELKRSQIGFEEYDSTIPKTEDIPDLVKRLEIVESLIKTLRSMGITSYNDVRITPGTVVKNSMTQADVYEKFVTTFQVSAPYEQFKNLLYALEHSSVYMVVSYCKVSGMSRDEVRADIAITAVRFLFQA